MTWELIWMLVILKIPVIYLSLVVWWAVRSKPQPLEPAVRTVVTDPDPDPKPGWRFSRLRPLRPGSGPHGVPSRSHRRRLARAGARQ
jgi:hypothetical protein